MSIVAFTENNIDTSTCVPTGRFCYTLPTCICTIMYFPLYFPLFFVLSAPRQDNAWKLICGYIRRSKESGAFVWRVYNYEACSFTKNLHNRMSELNLLLFCTVADVTIFVAPIYMYVFTVVTVVWALADLQSRRHYWTLLLNGEVIHVLVNFFLFFLLYIFVINIYTGSFSHKQYSSNVKPSRWMALTGWNELLAEQCIT